MEEKEFYSNIASVIACYVILGIFFTLSIIFLILKVIFGLIYLLMFIVFFIIIFINRKLNFSKIRVNDTGICRFYKKEIIHEIKWDDLIEVRCYKEDKLVFLDYIASDAEIENYADTNVMVEMFSYCTTILSLFKEHFKHKISNASSLRPYERNKLL